jgi:hypothetical protein
MMDYFIEHTPARPTKNALAAFLGGDMNAA